MKHFFIYLTVCIASAFIGIYLSRNYIDKEEYTVVVHDTVRIEDVKYKDSLVFVKQFTIDVDSITIDTISISVNGRNIDNKLKITVLE